MGTAAFTLEEFAKFVVLGTRLQHYVVDIELDLDDRRFQFAHWLVEHGLLSEDLDDIDDDPSA